MALGLIEQLRELLAAFSSEGVSAAAIGGLAVNAHGYPRATHDLDFLIDHADEPRVADMLGRLGYTAIDRRDDLSSWVRGMQRVDLLHARRPISRDLLAAALPTAFGELPLRVVGVEGLIGFKIQSYADDPRRLRDLSDIMELLRRHRTVLDMDAVRRYFALFDREDLLDEILAALDGP